MLILYHQRKSLKSNLFLEFLLIYIWLSCRRLKSPLSQLYTLCQHFGLTDPGEGLSLAKWIVVSGDRTAIACIAIEVHDYQYHSNSNPISYFVKRHKDLSLFPTYPTRNLFHGLLSIGNFLMTSN